MCAFSLMYLTREDSVKSPSEKTALSEYSCTSPSVQIELSVEVLSE